MSAVPSWLARSKERFHIKWIYAAPKGKSRNFNFASPAKESERIDAHVWLQLILTKKVWIQNFLSRGFKKDLCRARISFRITFISKDRLKIVNTNVQPLSIQNKFYSIVDLERDPVKLTQESTSSHPLSGWSLTLLDQTQLPIGDNAP